MGLIACTYVYFLIFAQFGFLKRLDQLGISGSHLKLVMGAMALGGVLTSLLAPRILVRSEPGLRVRYALTGCAVAALLTLLPLSPGSGIAVAALIGVSLGLLTITLVGNLDLWIDRSGALLKVALGTGLGYFLCNVPMLFTAPPPHIAMCAAAICLIGIPCTGSPRCSGLREEPSTGAAATPHFGLLLAWFTALIWLDSAAFFIIQNSPILKSGTWQGSAHLWRNGILHLLGALAGAWLLWRRGVMVTLLVAFACLAGACLLLLNPANAGFASVLYPSGVSLYSVVLVAAPSFFLRERSQKERERKAGWIYAVSGWIGSAMGIGMAQNLHRVPSAFVAAAAVLFLVPWVPRWRRAYLPQMAAVVVSLGLGLMLQHTVRTPQGSGAKGARLGSVERGRRVYISEGCIHCHSQYVRPHTPDVLMWGPTETLEAIRLEQPPLIGNRRQGPDLSQVGGRRSPLWLRIHFMNPRDVSFESIMPSYAYLFRDSRGDALIDYMESLKTPDNAEHLRQVHSAWKPLPSSGLGSDNTVGARQFSDHCATCHSLSGRARSKWDSSFTRLPPNLAMDALLYVPGPSAASAEREAKLEQIIKFGLPGTNMPGHEYLKDADIGAISAYLNAARITNKVVPSPPKRD